MKEETRIIRTKLYGDEDEREYTFEVYKNTEPIKAGDYFLFYYCGYHIEKCEHEGEEYELNPNNHVAKPETVIDLVTGFWKNCWKIKKTNYNL